MKAIKKLSSFLLAMVMCIGMFSITVLAASVSEDGLEITLTTDKEEYVRDEQITAILTVKNTNDFAVTNVSLEQLIPNGYKLPNGSSTIKQVASLGASETVTLTVTYTSATVSTNGNNKGDNNSANDGGKIDGNSTDNGNEAGSNTTNIGNGISNGSSINSNALSPKTSDEDNIVMPLVLLILSIALISFIVWKTKKEKQFFLLFLFCTLLNTLVFQNVVQAASEQRKTCNTEKVVKVAGTELKISAKVTYSIDNLIGGEITYTAPTESDIDSGNITYDGNTYTAKYVNNQLIIVLKDNANSGEIENILTIYDASLAGKIETVNTFQIKFSSAKTLDELNSIIASLIEMDIVEDAYLNTVVESDNMESQYYPDDMWDIAELETTVWDEYYPSGNNWGAEAIHAPSAWNLLISKYGSISQVPRIRIGVIDSYVDKKHEDLNVDAVYWYQTGLNIFKKDQSDTTAAEYAAAAENIEDFKHIIHGTHVTGTIGASFNNKGINGIAINPELYGASVAEASTDIIYTRFGLSTVLSNLIEDSICQVINYSQGYKNYIPYQAIDDGKKVGNVLKKYLEKNYDFVIVNAAGNDASRDSLYNSCFSAIRDPEVKSRIIVVGNAENDNTGTVFLHAGQSYGKRVDVVAPGTDIYSTVSPNPRAFSKGSLEYRANSSYMSLTGTSMAAPHVSGIAALIWAANPSLKGDSVKSIIVETANLPVNGNDSDGYSHKMVNAAYAVSEALGLDYVISGMCGSDLNWTLDGFGNLSIQGVGEMTCETDHAPWYRYREIIKNVEIGDGITSVYQNAFLDCSKVDSVKLGKDIMEVGYYAFGGMESLKSITIPKNVQEISEQAFGYNVSTPIDGFTIYGYSNTVSEKYAVDNGFAFVDLASETPDEPIKPSISGVVKNSSNEVLADVEIYVYDQNGFGPFFTGRTDTNGSFSIQIEERGTYSLKFVKEGYADQTKNNIEVSHDINIGNIVLFTGASVTGDGTAENPYRISTAEQLPVIANDLTAYYILANDIDCSELTSWNSIGTEESPFSGSIDGDGHTISGLICNQGIFGYVSKEGAVKNLRLTGISVSEGQCVGILAAHNGGTIEHCEVSGTVSGTTGDYYTNFAGGLIGDNAGVIQYCRVTTPQEGSLRGTVVGGIAGRNSGTITSCETSCAVSGNCYSNGLALSGGIAGWNYGGTITLCKSTCNISTIVTYAGCACGGISGMNSGTITTCYFNGTVYALARTTNYGGRGGGISGSNGDRWLGKGGSISECVYILSEDSSTTRLHTSDNTGSSGTIENNFDNSVDGKGIIDRVEATLNF